MADDPLQDETLRARPSERLAKPAQIEPGATIVDRYRILEIVGEGGMGVVYRARDLLLEADVALKLLHPDVAHDPARLAFFRNEVRLARRVTHANVCRLHDLEDGPNGWFITMEYVDGEPLSQRLCRSPLPPADALRVLRAVAAGLAAAHAAGVIHRDLKPSNVLLAGERVIVADFGIAGEGALLASGPQDIAGTAGYMAPEQARGTPLDARADVYAFGVLASVLLTGARPPPFMTNDVGGGSANALPVDNLRPLLDKLAPPLADLITACLATDQDARPADGGVLVARLAAATDLPRRRRWVVAAALAAAVAGAAVLITVVATHEVTSSTAPRLVLGPIDARALAAHEAWLGEAVQRLIANELDDAWGLELEPAPAATPSVLSRERSGRLRLTIDGVTLDAATPRELALVVAGHLAERAPQAMHHPTAAELAAAGTTDVEAWRAWRRAQRESLMQRWHRVIALCDEALLRDQGFPLAYMERAFVFDRRDRNSLEQLVVAARMIAARPTVASHWAVAVEVSRRLQGGDVAAATRLVEELRAGPVPARDRAYLDMRYVFSAFFVDAHSALPALESLVERYPREPAGWKALADLHLASVEPSAPVHALRAAKRAIELAPDDLGVRIDLASALALTGQLDEARARGAELAIATPDDKRLLGSRLFTMHMQLGEFAEAEFDARHELEGTPMQHAMGLFHAAVLDLYWGRLDEGLAALEAAAEAHDELGLSESAASQRMRAAQSAWRLGRLAEAEALFHRVAATTTKWSDEAAVLEHVVAGRLDPARGALERLPAGTSARAGAEVAIAAGARDAAAVIASHARFAKVSGSTSSHLELGEALEQLGRDVEAIATYEQLVENARSWREPIATALAWYRLGLLRERLGMPTARTAFEELLRRWGSAAAALPEVADARRRLR